MFENKINYKLLNIILLIFPLIPCLNDFKNSTFSSQTIFFIILKHPAKPKEAIIKQGNIYKIVYML